MWKGCLKSKLLKAMKVVILSGEGLSQYSVIASDRRERGDLSGAIASITRDCHVTALLAKTVYGAYVVNIHVYDTASESKGIDLVART